jgi:RimJ/RimL family protein N-acetyltransferase
MNKMSFKIEKIKRTHIKDLWRLRNNEQTRKISINKKPIQLNDHFIWFNKINQNKTKIFIAIDKKNEKIIGYVRFEKRNDTTEVSIAIYKEYQNKGFSKKILDISEKKIKTNYFKAKVHFNNPKSIALFKSLNYKSIKKEKNFLIMKKKKLTNTNKYLKIIQQIENVRKKNNSNWMDILRIAFKNSPDESAKIMGEIYSQDKKIGILSKKLSKKNPN